MRRARPRQQPRWRRRLEDALRRRLPEPWFRALVQAYQVLKNRYRLALLGFKAHAEQRSLAKGELPVVVNFDFYSWTGADLGGFLAEELRGRAAVIDRSMAWREFEEAGRASGFVFDPDRYQELCWDGLRLWEICKVSICKHTGRLVHRGEALSGEALEVVERYYRWAVGCHAMVSRILDTYSPATLLVCQGGVYDSRVVAELGRRRRINVVAVENSFVGSHFLADSLSGMIINRHGIAAIGDFALECEALNLEQMRSRVEAFCLTAAGSKRDEHRTGGIDGEAQVRAALSIPEGRRIVLFLGQVRTDASVVLDSTLYPDPVALVGELARFVGEVPDLHLVVRLHPKEATPTRYSREGRHVDVYDDISYKALKQAGLARLDRVHIVHSPNVSTYTLMDMSELGVTINSQSGLEMALRGKRVITAGRCFYAGKGFSWSLQSPSLLSRTLELALEEPSLCDAELEALHRFCYYLFFEYLIPKDLRSGTERLIQLCLPR